MYRGTRGTKRDLCMRAKETEETVPDDEDEDTSSDALVRRQRNRIYFYADVSTKTALKFNILLQEAIEESLKASTLQRGEPAPITVYINSYGGELHAGLSMMDAIGTSPVPVVTVADGFCASAATFMLMAGKERCMYPHAYVKIHQITTGFWGKFQDMLDEVKNSQAVMKTIKNVYLERSNMNRRELETLVNQELCLDAEECLRRSIVDRIM